MTDTTTAGATPAVPGAMPGQPPDTGTGADAGTATSEATGDGLHRALEAERKASREATRVAKDLQRELDAIKAERMTEQERREKRLTELEAENVTLRTARTDAVLRASVTAAASRLGFTNPEDALAFVRDQVALDDAGDPKDVDKAVAELAKDRPYLLAAKAGAGRFDLGTGGGQRPSAGRIYSRADLADHAFYAANKADILQAQREGRIRN